MNFLEGYRKLLLALLAIGASVTPTAFGHPLPDSVTILIGGVYLVFSVGNMIEHWTKKQEKLPMNFDLKPGVIIDAGANDGAIMDKLNEIHSEILNNPIETKTLETVVACQEALRFVVQYIQQSATRPGA